MTITTEEFVANAEAFIDFGERAKVIYENGEVDSLEHFTQSLNRGDGVPLFPVTTTDGDIAGLGWKFLDENGEHLPIEHLNGYLRMYNALVYGDGDPLGQLAYAKTVTVTFSNGETDSLAGAANGCDDGSGCPLFTEEDVRSGDIEFTDADGDEVSIDRVNEYVRAYNLGIYRVADPRGEEENA